MCLYFAAYFLSHPILHEKHYKLLGGHVFNPKMGHRLGAGLLMPLLTDNKA